MLLGLYLAYGLAMTFVHPAFLYPFSQEEIAFQSYERVMIDLPGADPLRVVVTTPDADDAPLVLFFMGNAGNIGHFIPWLNLHTKAGRRVVAMEYRGGGGLPGTPSEVQLKADALATYDWAVAEYGGGQVGGGQVILHGYSLGTGLALHVAARRPVSGIVLDAPFARICDLMQHASLLPACYIPGVQKWNSLRDVPALSEERVLILHGVNDSQIPIAEGRRLQAALRGSGAAVDFTDVAGGTHSNLPRQPGYIAALEAFLADLPDGKPADR